MKYALTLLLATAALAQEQVWTWVDEKGEEHYTNDPNAIPKAWRGKARPVSGEDLSVVKTGDTTATTEVAPTPSKAIVPQGKKPAQGSESRALRVLLFEASTNSASKTLSRAGVLDKLISNNPGLKLERIEFSSAVDRAEKLNVTQIPTVLFLDETDTVLGRATGLVTLKALQAQLNRIRGATE